MKTIDAVIGDVLRREAWPTFTDRPSDKGGPTKGGVTLANYNAWLIKNGQTPITVAQLQDLKESSARAFLLDEFSRPFQFIADEGIFTMLVDWAVNSGPDDPARALQAALKLHGLYAGAIDGAPGGQTIAAWRRVEGDFGLCHQIEEQLLLARVDFYLDCALNDAVTAAFIKATPTTQLRNLRGWISRTLEFL